MIRREVGREGTCRRRSMGREKQVGLTLTIVWVMSGRSPPQRGWMERFDAWSKRRDRVGELLEHVFAFSRIN